MGAQEKKQIFAIVYTTGPAWIAGKPIVEQPLRAHLDYMHHLEKTKRLIGGGPFLDDTGGLAIIEVADAAAAAVVVAEDPAVVAKVFTAALHPWYRVQWERYEQLRARLTH